MFLQRSEGGLFVDMNSFLAFGKEFVDWNYEKTGNPIYLHIIETQKPVSEDRPSKKPTLLAIGTELIIMSTGCLHIRHAFKVYYQFIS